MRTSRSGRRCGWGTRRSWRPGSHCNSTAPMAFGVMAFADDAAKVHRQLSHSIEVIDAATANIPPEAMRMHVCWGNYEGAAPPRRAARADPARSARRETGRPGDRGCQSAARPRVGRDRRAWPARRQDDRARPHRLDVELGRAPRPRRAATPSLRRRGRPRAHDGRRRLRVRHDRGSPQRGARHRRGEVRVAGRGQATRRGRPAPAVHQRPGARHSSTAAGSVRRACRVGRWRGRGRRSGRGSRRSSGRAGG